MSSYSTNMPGVTKNTITITSTSTVRSRAPAPAGDVDRRVELTPWDLQFLLTGPIQKGLLFHKPKDDVITDLLFHRLETSLSRTLDFFPPLAGRLSRTDNEDGTTASFFIDCNNVGAQLVRATAADSISVSDILGALYVPEVVMSFFPLNGVANLEGVAQPLLAVQVTELRDGVFVGCTVNHVVADGSSFWHFLNSWSEISRGCDAPTKPPSLRRWFPGGVECPVRIPLVKLQEKHVRLYRDYRPTNLADRIFHFGKERVAELKAKANSEMETDGRISSLEAVLAHLWRSIIRSRQSISDEEEVRFALLVGARQRLRSLPGQYFGNAIQLANITLKTSEVVEKGVGHVAWEMNKTIGSQTQQNIETTLDHWAANPTFPLIIDKTSAYLVASSSPRFNVYGNDFGWGLPVAVMSGAGNKRDGTLNIFPGVEPGSIELHTCLLPQIMCVMEKDVEFTNKVTP